MVAGPIRCDSSHITFNFSAAIAAPLLVAFLARDRILSRLDGVILLLAFSCWLIASVRHAIRSRQHHPAADENQTPLKHAIPGLIFGIMFLVTAARLVVLGAEGVAHWFDLNIFVVGAVMVALGTSTPELVTTLYARFRGHDDIGIGNIIGSNVFNLLFIIAIAALLCPIRFVGPHPYVTLAVGLSAAACCWPGRDNVLGRWRGGLLLLIYVGYLALISGLR